MILTTKQVAKIIIRTVKEKVRSKQKRRQKPETFDHLRDEIKLYQTIVSHKSHPSALNGEGKKLEG